jgi:UDP-N-acetylmuramate--alanine ligase
VHQAVRNYTQRGSGYFQPHLFSRTSDFADDFAKVYLILMNFVDGYLSSQRASYGRITSEWLLSKMAIRIKKLVTKENIIESILKEYCLSNCDHRAGDRRISWTH